MADLRTQIRRTGRYQRRRHVPAEHHLGCDRTGTEPAGFDETDPGKETYQFYTINAVKIAQDIGLGGRFNMIMQSAFFKLADIIPVEDAVKYLKDAVVTNYGKKGRKSSI